MTFIVHASKGDEVAVTIRLRAIAAVAKARSLCSDGWDVYIVSPGDIRYAPAEFDKLLACSTF